MEHPAILDSGRGVRCHKMVADGTCSARLAAIMETLKQDAAGLLGCHQNCLDPLEQVRLGREGTEWAEEKEE